MEIPSKSVFVTVGSTSFEELVSAVIQKESIDALESDGYTDLVIQYGAYVVCSS